ncbi:bifunctional diguanylate cyclase/phosphodiesterase [Maricaulis sp. CAU 1757]
MSHIFHSLTGQHDARLLVVVLLLCALTALASTATARRAMDARGLRQLAWLGTAAMVTGTGVWGTHFVAMLAYESTVEFTYSIPGTVLSLLLGIGAALGGWAYAARAGHLYRGAVGGMIIGGGIALIHFTGMAAMRFAGRVEWDAGMLIAAIVLGVQFAGLAGLAIERLNFKRGLLAGSAMLLLAVVSLHFVGMGAMQIEPDSSVFKGDGLSPRLLLIAIALGVVLVTGIGLGAAGVDAMLGARREAELERFRALADATSEGLAVVRDGVMSDMNSRFCDMLKLGREDLIGMPLSKLTLQSSSPDQSVQLDDFQPLTMKLRCRDGSDITVQVRCKDIEYDGLPAQVFAFRDVSVEERARARITHLAHHDSLTSLPNRLRFREKLESELARAWRTDTLVGVAFFDLDRFKEVNDVHGHAIGDDLLREVSERLINALPEEAYAARLSGDEFAVILPDVASRQSAAVTAQRVVDAIGSPVRLGSLDLKVSASGGLTVFPLDGEDIDRLMNQADMALYRAKGLGRNRLSEFDPKLGLLMQERRMLEADLALAIEDEMLDLNFQPQICLGSGEVVGYEALLRWHHPKRGQVSPGEFVQVAEETGMILKMGAWVIADACREAVKWPDGQHVAINVSPAQFKQGNLVRTVEAALARSGLDPSQLEIEITEGVLIDDEDRAREVMHGLKRLGVGLSLDDFGTGYSSLGYLRAFPFDKIKIDRSFVTGIQNDPEARIIVGATIDLARQLDIAVVVEGVETFEELAALGGHPDLVMQGYLLSRPVSRGALASFSRDHAELCRRIAETANGEAGADDPDWRQQA